MCHGKVRALGGFEGVRGGFDECVCEGEVAERVHVRVGEGV